MSLEVQLEHGKTLSSGTMFALRIKRKSSCIKPMCVALMLEAVETDAVEWSNRGRSESTA